jgi:hypothetical protein
MLGFIMFINNIEDPFATMVFHNMEGERESERESTIIRPKISFNVFVLYAMAVK